VLLETVTAALICLDPGHGTAPDVARGTEPIGPGATSRNIVDGGGTPGEAEVVLAISRRARGLLLAAGYRVAMTRTAPGYRGTNADRARFCNRRGAALIVRIHADGSTEPGTHGAATLYPAARRGWTDDVAAESRRAARLLQGAVVAATGARDLGIRRRSDLVGFNFADVPVVLVETGFLTNPREGAWLRSGAYQQRVARGIFAGVAAFAGPPES
jgi:N-acetylmuramoyl-L-alanine amidase